ncbi:MAG: hypothetical protein J6K72_04275 [Clostridia bacterium]|nr:hypothetical protein [Clostridia bacterium]
MANNGCLSTIFSLLMGGGSSSSSGGGLMNGVVGDVLDDLIDTNSGNGGLGDMLGGLTGGDSEGGLGDMLGGLGDTFTDLTGIGATNTEASDMAKEKGANKISASGKKPSSLSSASSKEKAGRHRPSVQRERASASSGSTVQSAAQAAKERAKEKASRPRPQREKISASSGSTVQSAAQAAKERAREKAGKTGSSGKLGTARRPSSLSGKKKTRDL